MSNLTLKEQLEALSLGSSSPPSPDKVKKPLKKPVRSQVRSNEKVRPKPAWLEQAQYGVELLRAHFPLCFKEMKDTKPLKIGIKQDLVKHLSGREDIVLADKACMVSSLAYYVSSVAYHKNVLAGVPRIDLEGNADGLVTPEEAQYSSECRQSKMQRNKKAAAPSDSDKVRESN